MTAARQLIANLFPNREEARVQTIAVTGTNGKTTTCRMIEKILRTKGLRVSLACSNGLYFNGKIEKSGVFSGIAGAISLFRNPKCEAVVLETSQGTLLEKGLTFRTCDVGVCTNVAYDHIGQGGITSLEEMAVLKRRVLESAEKMAVVNGDAPLCREMVPLCTSQQVCMVGIKGDAPDIGLHLENGGSAVLYDENTGCITLHTRTKKTELFNVRQIPATHSGKALFNVENTMHAIGAAVGLDIDEEVIKEALVNFSLSYENTPGRLNIHNAYNRTMILDYAHNYHGITAVTNFAQRLPMEGKRIVAFAAVASHSDELICNNALAVAGHFDHYICCNYENLRGEAPNKVPDMLKQTLLEQGISSELVTVLYDAPIIVLEYAMQMSEKGDVVLLLLDDKEHYWDLITNFQPLEEQQS